MNIRKILCPIDYSHASYAALEVAASLARASKAVLVVLHCEDVPVGGEYSYGVPVARREELEADLDQAISEVRGVQCEKRLLSGSPQQAILGLAESESVDLIVVGTHGRSGLPRLLLGSIAEAVVRLAKCPVLTVRQALQ